MANRIHQEKLDAYRTSLRYYGYSISHMDVDAVLSYMHEHYRFRNSIPVRPHIPAGFTPNLLNAVKAINKYAAYNSIRFEDALLVLHEFTTKPVPAGIRFEDLA